MLWNIKYSIINHMFVFVYLLEYKYLIFKHRDINFEQINRWRKRKTTSMKLYAATLKRRPWLAS